MTNAISKSRVWGSGCGGAGLALWLWLHRAGFGSYYWLALSASLAAAAVGLYTLWRAHANRFLSAVSDLERFILNLLGLAGLSILVPWLFVGVFLIAMGVFGLHT